MSIVKTGFFGRLLSRTKAKDAKAIALPQDVVALVSEGRCYPLSGFIEWTCHQDDKALLVGELELQAVAANWSAVELAKVAGYSRYFSGDFEGAYNASSSHLHGEAFDPDFFGIAIMSLFSGSRYRDAYCLLLDSATHRDQLEGNYDYLVCAAIVCWCVGDRYRANDYVDAAVSFPGVDALKRQVALYNALAIHAELGNDEGTNAVLVAIDAIAAAERQPNLTWGRAFYELSCNHYQEGFRMAEARYQMSEASRHMRRELLDRPRWDRESIRDKTLLIHGEQGLGDMIQTARFFPACVDAAAKVIVECPDESIALLQHNFPQITYVPLRNEPVGQPYDVWTGTMSLPYQFDVTETTVPHRNGYLEVPDDHLAYWRECVAAKSNNRSLCKIGVAWSGFPGHRADSRRSVPWGLVKKLLEQYPDIDFFAVQTKVPNDLPQNVHDCTEEMATLSDTAALVSLMDLVISVDTSVVHIAGAIAKETWMMLPYRYEWRWGGDGEENPWYDSVKVIRQPSPGAWAPVLSQVFGRRLRKFLAERQRS